DATPSRVARAVQKVLLSVERKEDPSMERFAKLSAALALLVTLAGCGAATTAPVMTGSADTTAQQSPDDTPAPGGSTATQTPPSSGSLGPIGTVIGAVRGLLTRTVELVGELGVNVDNGRWHAAVPPNAIQGDAQVTIGVSSRLSGECVI